MPTARSGFADTGDATISAYHYSAAQSTLKHIARPHIVRARLHLV